MKQYDRVIGAIVFKNEELTTEQLNYCGFDSKGIAELIEQGILVRVKRDYYKAIEDLLHNSQINDRPRDMSLHIPEWLRKNSLKDTDQQHTEKLAKEESQIKEPQTTIPSSICNDVFNDVIRYLLEKDLDNCFISLRIYLEIIGKREYEYLITDLIKLSLNSMYYSFTKTVDVLTRLKKDNFEFNISEYKQEFDKALDQNNLENAIIYLYIISNLAILYKDKNLEETNRLVDNMERKLKNKQAETYREQYETYPEQYETYRGQTTTSQSKKDKFYYANELINQKWVEISEKGIVLLDPMNEERINEIQKIVGIIPELVSFIIGSGNSRQVVLKSTPMDVFGNTSEILKEGNAAYKNKDYDTCIKRYKEVLKQSNPKPVVYAKLGVAYMKKNDIKTAINYLTIANELNKNVDPKYDYTELIDWLSRKKSVKDKKTYVKMDINDFKNDMENYYGIEQVEDIAELVCSGMTIEDACLSMGLNEEERSTIELIFAREYYAQENYKMGDQYLKKVERTKDKSKFIKNLMEEIRKSKKFYKNRVRENDKHLVLTSRTKKQN